MSTKKELLIGLISGILLTFIISLIVFLRSNPGFSFGDYFDIFANGSVLSPILSVALVGNLGLFFLFLKFEKDTMSRGVLMATMLIGIIIFILKVI